MTTVLLADGVELFLELGKSFLEGVGFRVVTARSGREALARLEEEKPAVLLLDLHLPGPGGAEICRRLRWTERWRDLPILMFTAAGRDEEIRRCLDAGCDDILTRPMGKKDLLEKIRRVLGLVRGRTAERVPVPLRVRLRSGEKDLTLQARDISSNGIYVRSRSFLKPGTVVELNLDIPGRGAVPVLGKVKRVQTGADGGMGIYFIHPEPLGQRALAGLVEEMRRESGKIPAQPKPEAVVPAALEEENRRLRQRIGELEEENREFAERIIRSEEVNTTLTGLYVASSRLHSVLDREQVANIVKEVVIHFIGAETFALLTVHPPSGELRYETGEGFEDGFPPLVAGQGIWPGVIERRESYFRDAPGEGSDDPAAPIAAIPLSVNDKPVGVLAVYRLFIRKDAFTPGDLQLFSMLAEHAATALFSSMLYQESERKRETYRGFMDLLLK